LRGEPNIAKRAQALAREMTAREIAEGQKIGRVRLKQIRRQRKQS
jgi:hypothetical protein